MTPPRPTALTAQRLRVARRMLADLEWLCATQDTPENVLALDRMRAEYERLRRRHEDGETYDPDH